MEICTVSTASSAGCAISPDVMLGVACISGRCRGPLYTWVNLNIGPLLNLASEPVFLNDFCTLLKCKYNLEIDSRFLFVSKK